MLGIQYLHDLPERPKPVVVSEAAEGWRPYRSAAALLVWDYYGSVVAARRQAAKAAKTSATVPPKKAAERAAVPLRSRKSR
jgi:3-methyladenine DNA glycosylase/8-oxoguanine DNA glycosylase